MSQPNNRLYPPNVPQPTPQNNPTNMAQPDPTNIPQSYPPNTPPPYPPNMSPYYPPYAFQSYPPNTPPPYPPNMSPYYPPYIPQPRTMTSSSWFSTRLLRIFLILFGMMALVIIPLLTYFIGTLIGIHMSSNDVNQGYAYGGLLYTIYNATHNPVYYQQSQISQSQGIAEGQSDISTLQFIGLGMGFVMDVAIVFLLIKEYERMR